MAHSHEKNEELDFDELILMGFLVQIILFYDSSSRKLGVRRQFWYQITWRHNYATPSPPPLCIDEIIIIQHHHLLLLLLLLWRCCCCCGGGVVIVVVVVVVEVVVLLLLLLARWIAPSSSSPSSSLMTGRCVNKAIQTEPVGCYENTFISNFTQLCKASV